MTFNLNVAVITLAIISQDVRCKKATEIEFVKDYMQADSSRSIKVIAFLCWDKGLTPTIGIHK